MGDGYSWNSQADEVEDGYERITCVMCGGTWWWNTRYVAARKGWLWRLIRKARRECLTADCSTCGYVSSWRPGTIRPSGSRKRFGV